MGEGAEVSWLGDVEGDVDWSEVFLYFFDDVLRDFGIERVGVYGYGRFVILLFDLVVYGLE